MFNYKSNCSFFPLIHAQFNSIYFNGTIKVLCAHFLFCFAHSVGNNHLKFQITLHNQNWNVRYSLWVQFTDITTDILQFNSIIFVFIYGHLKLD